MPRQSDRGRSGDPSRRVRLDRRLAAVRDRRAVRWALLGVLLGVIGFGLLRLVPFTAEPANDSAVFTGKVIVVGVTGRYEATAGDRQLLDDQAANAQYGAVVVRPRYVGDCAAAGWTTLGAGRRAAVSPSQDALGGPLCAAPAVTANRVTDWAARVAAAQARAGDAQPGTLGGSGGAGETRCVAAVGPYAALAAARPDGTVTSYRTAAQYQEAAYASPCPLTLVDGGTDPGPLIAALVALPDTTVIVTGIGPDPGSDNPGVQLIYRIGTTLPGAMTSDSTRRDGLVGLTDLTATLVDFVQTGVENPTAVAIDGAGIKVADGTVSGATAAANLAAVTAQSDAVVTGYLTFGVGGALVVAMVVGAALARRFRVSRALLVMGAGQSAGMMLVGAYPWYRSDHPGAVLSVTIWLWGAAIAGLTVLLSRRTGMPLAVAAAVWTTTAFTVDAALGTPMQAGSMLNSRPIFGLRYYGFGNVTFAAYAAAGLLVAGWLANHAREHRHRRRAMLLVLAVGLVLVVCEGWPTMGTDFGGVIALTPPVLGLALYASGRRVGPLRVLLVLVAGVVAVAAVSLLDWQRGAANRSHLGNFVQRVIDGDAADVVIRKAAASVGTLTSLLGVVGLVIGVALWLVIFRVAIPRIAGFPMLAPTAVAGLATAVLGTLLNDGGISVWIMFTAAFSVSIGCLYLDRCVSTRQLQPEPVAGVR